MKKILVIDDHLSFAKIIESALPNDKYQVVTATDGIEGLVALEKEKPDLILCDIVMPQMGGIEFLREVKKRTGGFPTPVLIMSNVSDMQQISEGVELGVKGYILKSAEDLSTIITTIKRALGDQA